MRFSCLLFLACLTGCAGRDLSTNRNEAIRDARAAALIERGTPESLATASVMLGLKQNSKSLALIERAGALAPRRAEISYLRWRACAGEQCPEEARYIAELKTIDPGNGMAWLPELNAAFDRDDQPEVTRIIEIIGTLRGLDIYWNNTVVMMVDALGEIAVRDANTPPLTLPERMVTTIGLLAAMSIPPMQPLSKACRQTQFDEPGRRSACEAMASRLRQSDTMIVQSLGLTFQTRWSPEDSPERENLKAQKRQFYYLLDASTKERQFHSSTDFATRLEAMRHSTSEAEVAQAMLISFHEPLERPLNWKDPFPRFE
jgi:hypothetical protein